MSTSRKTRHRGNNEGSIYRRKEDGLWVAAISLGYDENGKLRRRVIYGRTKREVQQKMSELMDAHRLGRNIEVKNISVREHFEGWLTEKARAVQPNTLSKYENHVNNHIIPALGRVKLTDLNYTHINQFFEDLEKKTRPDGTQRLGPTTRADIARVLSMGLNDAVAKGLISKNPAHLVEQPQENEEEPRFMTDDEWTRWVDAADGERLRELYIVGVHTGLRPSELLGLPWTNVDLERRQIKVAQALHEDGGRIWIGKLKTKYSYRTVSIGNECIAALKRQRKRQLEDRLRVGDKWQRPDVDRPYSNDLVFSTDTGGWLRRSTIYKYDLARVRERSGLHDVGLHTLRHTHAAILIHMGARPLEIRDRLGHKDVAFTLQRYGHLFPDYDERCAQMMDEFEEQRLRGVSAL